MPRIDAASQLAALIQAQLRAAAPGGRAPQNRTRRASPSGVDTKPDAAAVVSRRVQLIASDDSQRERKALRIFLEAVILEEMGTGLAADARFQEMLDHVQSQFDADAQLSAAAGEAARLLLAAQPETGP